MSIVKVADKTGYGVIAVQTEVLTNLTHLIGPRLHSTNCDILHNISTTAHYILCIEIFISFVR